MESVVTQPFVSETITPSGIEIRFVSGEKFREYKIRWVKAAGIEEPEDHWRKVPGVTDVLNLLDKPGLVHWGQDIGIRGAMFASQKLEEPDFDQIKAHMKEEKIDVTSMKGTASDRGLAVHKALEEWAATSKMPDLIDYPPEEQGYVQGLLGFLMDVSPVPLATETMVASIEHGFAGRYDIHLEIPKETKVSYKCTPVRGCNYKTINPCNLVVDLKTSKYVYLSHHRQLAGYKIARRESGFADPDDFAILHVTPEGHYELVRSVGDDESFLSCLAVYNSEQQMKERLSNEKTRLQESS